MDYKLSYDGLQVFVRWSTSSRLSLESRVEKSCVVVRVYPHRAPEPRLAVHRICGYTYFTIYYGLQVHHSLPS